MKELRAPLLGHPSLARGIGHVIRLGSYPKMIRSATRRIIARMHNDHSFGDRAIGQFPCEAMGENLPVTDSDTTVSLPMARSGPFPTTGTYLNLRPEASSIITPNPFGVQRVAVTTPPGVVHPTVTAGDGGLRAIGDGTGRLGAHSEPPIPDVMPRAVTSSAGVFSCPNFTVTMREGG